MTKTVMEASHAISEAVKMIKPGVVAAYPITPQTHIVERISDFVADGDLRQNTSGLNLNLGQYLPVWEHLLPESGCIHQHPLRV